MVTGILERCQRTNHVIHQRKTLRPPAKILIDGFDQRLLIAHQQVDNPLNPFLALRGTDRASFDKGFFLCGQQAGQLFGGGVGISH